MRMLSPRTGIRNTDHFRFCISRFVSSSSSTQSNANKDKEGDTIVTSTATDTTPSTKTSSTLLYKRNASKALFPRALLSLSTVHTGYWTWYVLDFTPSIQASTTAAIDNTVGYLGLGLAIFMSIGSLIYPKSLIQEIQLETTRTILSSASAGTSAGTSDDHNKTSSSIVQVRTYSLPFVTPSSTPMTFALGDVVIDSPNDTKQIITDYKGDISQYSGYLPIHAEGRYINLLLQLSDNENANPNPNVNANTNSNANANDHDKDMTKMEIYEKELLFNSLVSPNLSNVLDYSNESKKKGGGNKSPETLLKIQKRKERKMKRRR
jgi:hypothetical protein